MFTSHRISVRTAALLILPALFIARSALADVAPEAPLAVTVHYDDLNLNRAGDVASLYKRIKNAATEVCQPVQGPESVSRALWTAWNQCFYHAIGEAVHAVHNDRLSAYYWQRTHGLGYPDAESPAIVARR